MKKINKGFMLITAVIMIAVVAVFLSAAVYYYTAHVSSNVGYLASNQALYIAEAGINKATLAVTTTDVSTRIPCSQVSATFNNIAYANGRYTVTGVASTNNGTITGITPTDTCIHFGYWIGWWIHWGRVFIDHEGFDYDGFCDGGWGLRIRHRGWGTPPGSHASGATVVQNQCTLTSTGTVDKPYAKRVIKRVISQIQEAWAVGNNGTIVKWDGNNWTKVNPSPTTNVTLNNVGMLNYGDGWIVGNKASGTTNATIYRFQSGTWNKINNTVNKSLYGVSAVSSTEAWAVGERGIIAKWNGTSWSVLPNSTNPINNTTIKLNSVSVIDTNGNGVGDFGYAVGDRDSSNKGVVMYYNGTSWSNVTSSVSAPWSWWYNPYPYDLNEVTLLSNSQGTIVGDNLVTFTLSGPNNWVYNYLGGWWWWHGGNMYGIDQVDNDGNGTIDYRFAVGNGKYYSWQPNHWSAVDSAYGTLYGAAIFGQNDVWAVGAPYYTGGKTYCIFHWDGRNWVAVQVTGVNQQLNAISKSVINSELKISTWTDVGN